MNTSTETCPSLEDLAAFLDGRLSKDERARVVAHLADCPRCYEIFTEAARFKVSEEEEGGEGEDADPPRKIFRWVFSIAAVLASVAMAIPLYQQYYTVPELSSKDLISRGLAQDDFWPVFRGGPASTSALMTPHEVLLGAHLVDLQLGLLQKNQRVADDALAAINGHIDELGSQADTQEKFYEDARDQLSKGTLPQDFLRQAEQVEASFRSNTTSYLDFGKWLEAGRLSSLTQNPAFFQVARNLKFPQTFLHQEREDLDSEVMGDLEDIQEMLATSAPSSLPYKDLHTRFEKILNFYLDQSKQSLLPPNLTPAP